MCQKIPLRSFSDIFSKWLGIFSPNFTHLLYVPIYAALHFFYSVICNFDEVMPPILCATNIMCSKCPPLAKTQAVWSQLTWHNFVTVVDNWIKICSRTWIGTYNRRVKFGLKIPNHFEKKCQKNSGGGDFFDSHCIWPVKPWTNLADLTADGDNSW